MIVNICLPLSIQPQEERVMGHSGDHDQNDEKRFYQLENEYDHNFKLVRAEKTGDADDDDDADKQYLKEDAEQIIHLCVPAKGSGPDCGSCPVNRLGYCAQLLTAIEKWDINLKGKGINHYAVRRDIISFTVASIIASINSFQGRSKFTTWAWSVFKNSMADYYRKMTRQIPANAISIDSYVFYDDDGNVGEGMQLPDDSAKPAMQSPVFEILSEISSNPSDRDYKAALFLINFYNKSESGRGQKEIAAQEGMLPNTYNQQLKRSRAALKRRFKGILN